MKEQLKQIASYQTIFISKMSIKLFCQLEKLFKNKFCMLQNNMGTFAYYVTQKIDLSDPPSPPRNANVRFYIWQNHIA